MLARLPPAIRMPMQRPNPSTSMARPGRRTSLAASRRVRWLALLLVCAVVLLQTLGLLHRTVHADRLGAVAVAGASDEAAMQGAAASVDSTADSPRADDGSARNPIAKLFAGHHGHDCDRYDQASHADLVFCLAFGLPSVLPPQPRLGSHPAWHIAAQARGFLARAPPVLA